MCHSPVVLASDAGFSSRVSKSKGVENISDRDVSLLWDRAVTPDFGGLTNVQYRLEGAFRGVHSRLRMHAESVAFFGGGAKEVLAT